MDLVRAAHGMLTASARAKIAAWADQPIEATAAALTHAATALVGAMVAKASTEHGARELIGLLERLELSARTLASPADLAEPGGDRLRKLGVVIVEELFGERAIYLERALSGLTGLSYASIQQLLPLVGTVAASVLLRSAPPSGFTPAALVSFLAKQKSNIANAAPPALRSVLEGLPRLGDLSLYLTAPAPAPPPETPPKRPVNYAPWLLVAVCVGLLLWLAPRLAHRSTEAPPARADTDAPSEPVPAQAPAPPSAPVPAPPPAAAIPLAPGSAAAQMQSFLSAPEGAQQTFRLSSLAFRHGHAQLSAAGKAELQAIAAALASFPNARVRFIGHTDSSGPSAINLEVSKARANAARAALVAAGFPAARVAAEGMGETQPIASNAAATGRWRNRRVEIVVSR